MDELYAEGARLLGSRDASGSGSGSGSGGEGGGNRGSNNRGSCRQVLERNGVDIGDTVAIVLEGGGPILIGTLVAFTDSFLRIVLTEAVNGIPEGTLLTVDCRDIASFGRITITTENGGGAV